MPEDENILKAIQTNPNDNGLRLRHAKRLAAIDHPPVENCTVAFQLICPKQWDQMQPTADDTVRFCQTCEQKVYYCATIKEAHKHARQGHCISVCSHMVRRDPGFGPRAESIMPSQLPDPTPLMTRYPDPLGGRTGGIPLRDEPHESYKWWQFWKR